MQRGLDTTNHEITVNYKNQRSQKVKTWKFGAAYIAIIFEQCNESSAGNSC